MKIENILINNYINNNHIILKNIIKQLEELDLLYNTTDYYYYYKKLCSDYFNANYYKKLLPITENNYNRKIEEQNIIFIELSNKAKRKVNFK
jgi:hypothetical protein